MSGSQSESEDPFVRDADTVLPILPPPPSSEISAQESLDLRKAAKRKKKIQEFVWSVRVSAAGCFLLAVAATLSTHLLSHFPYILLTCELLIQVSF